MKTVDLWFLSHCHLHLQSHDVRAPSPSTEYRFYCCCYNLIFNRNNFSVYLDLLFKTLHSTQTESEAETQRLNGNFHCTLIAFCMTGYRQPQLQKASSSLHLHGLLFCLFVGSFCFLASSCLSRTNGFSAAIHSHALFLFHFHSTLNDGQYMSVLTCIYCSCSIIEQSPYCFCLTNIACYRQVVSSAAYLAYWLIIAL